MDDTTADSRVQIHRYCAKLVALQFQPDSRRSSAIAGRGAFNREISMPANWSINYCCRIADLPVSLSVRVTTRFSIFFFFLLNERRFSCHSNFACGVWCGVEPTGRCLLLSFFLYIFIVILIVQELGKMKSI